MKSLAVVRSAWYEFAVTATLHYIMAGGSIEELSRPWNTQPPSLEATFTSARVLHRLGPESSVADFGSIVQTAYLNGPGEVFAK